jgi:hypothetical protein
MRSLVRPVLAACLALAALTACGTTVSSSQQALAGADAGGDGLGLPGGDGLSAPGTSTDGLGGTRTPSGGPGATAGPLPSAGGSLGPVSVPGTATAGKKPMVVGIAIVKDAGAGLKSLGLSGTLGDMRAYSEALVTDMNSRGGFGGRPIKPVYFGYDVNPGSASYAEQDAQACAAFTQDSHIEVGVLNFAGDGLWTCLQKRGVPMVIDGATGGVGEGDLARFRSLIVLGGMNLQRRATEEVNTLVRARYFTKWDAAQGRPGGVQPVKVGVITYDLPDWKSSVNNQMTQGLVAAGYGKPQVVAVSPHSSYSDLTSMTGQISGAVLAFRAAGVTHVIIWDDNGVSTLFWMQAAESQGYRPRVGITSGNNMKLISGGLANPNQLRGAVGMGWVPAFDVPEGDSSNGPYSNAARKRCVSIMTKAKLTASGFNELTAMMYCGSFFGIEQGFRAMRNPSPAGLVAAIESLGSSFQDPSVHATFLSPKRHDGLAAVFDYAYVESCSCMRYTSPPRPLARP